MHAVVRALVALLLGAMVGCGAGGLVFVFVLAVKPGGSFDRAVDGIAWALVSASVAALGVGLAAAAMAFRALGRPSVERAS